MDFAETASPWLLATLIFLVLLGGGRTLRGRLLGHPPFGSGVVLSVGLGVLLFSMIWMGLGHFGGLRSPWPGLVLGFGVLLALPGLLWTWRDYSDLAPGLERGFGPRWFAGGAWFLLIAALLVSFFWISGVFSYGGLGFIFERPGLDYAVGHSFFDPDFPRDPFLGDEPLDLWLYGLGSPVASLALSWWLGVAILFGVCGLGWRLHAHGAGLAAASLLSIVLFASDRPLFLAPALPAAVALMAVMVLAVESRGRPHLGRSLVAGGLGGFALISDLGAGAMLVPLLLFGPSWCKLASRDRLGLTPRIIVDENGGGGVSDGATDEAFDRLDYEEDLKKGWDDKGFEEGVKLLGLKKWLTPLRHTAYGLIGFSLPLTPWLLRNDAWVGDPCYGFDQDFHVEADYRYHDFSRDELHFQPSYEFTPGLGVQYRGEAGQPPAVSPRLQVDPLYIDYQPDFGLDFLDDNDFFDSYLCATEWGLGLGLLGLFAPFYGWRRWEPIVYIAPAFAGYAAGAYLGDFETTTPSALGLLSVGAGSSLYTMRGCGPSGRTLTFGGTLATGGLAIGLSGAYDCDYWPTWQEYGNFPQFDFHYDEPPPEEDYGFVPELRYKWPKFELGYTFEPQDEPPENDPWEYGAGLRYEYNYNWRLELRANYQLPDDDDDDDDRGTVPAVPGTTPGFTDPGYKLPEDQPRGDPRDKPARPTLPKFNPDVRPDLQPNVTPKNVPNTPGYPIQPGYPKTTPP